MKTKPDHLPALPDGAVYLGECGEFKLLPGGRCFAGRFWEPGMTGWYRSTGCSGTCGGYHYCAPADSEIVKLNAPAQQPADPLALVLTPIKRTDEAQAASYLRWLASSAYHHSIDDDPTGIPSINQNVAPHLRARAAECITALGYNHAWKVFSNE